MPLSSSARTRCEPQWNRTPCAVSACCNAPATVLVGVAHDLAATLDHADLHAESGELVARFQPDGPRAEDDDGLGVRLGFEDFVAGQVADFLEAGDQARRRRASRWR